MRFGWNASLSASLEYWQQREAAFDGVVTTELLSTATDAELRALKGILRAKARLLLLEPRSDISSLVQVLGRRRDEAFSVSRASASVFSEQRT